MLLGIRRIGQVFGPNGYSLVRLDPSGLLLLKKSIACGPDCWLIGASHGDLQHVQENAVCCPFYIGNRGMRERTHGKEHWSALATEDLEFIRRTIEA